MSSITIKQPTKLVNYHDIKLLIQTNNMTLPKYQCLSLFVKCLALQFKLADLLPQRDLYNVYNTRMQYILTTSLFTKVMSWMYYRIIFHSMVQYLPVSYSIWDQNL